MEKKKTNNEDEITEEYILTEIEKIKKQVEEVSLAREKTSMDFVNCTNTSIPLSPISIDDTGKISETIRNKVKFRNYITKFEEDLANSPDGLVGQALERLNPLKHSFADGCYIREIFNPAGELIVTKIHKQKHPFFLMKGKMSILTEKGIEHIEAPYHGITVPGTKRIIYAHTDCIFITVHATDYTDVATIEKEIVAENFNDPAITKEDVETLKENVNMKKQIKE